MVNEELKGITTDAVFTTESVHQLKPGDEGYIDPVELEKNMVEAEAARMNAPPARDDAEVASMMLSLYTPRFNKLVNGLSNRELKRLIKALVEFPLGKEYKHISQEEQEAFMIGQALTDAKMVLVMKTYSENRDEIIALAAEAAKNGEFTFGETNEEKDEGKDNGKA